MKYQGVIFDFNGTLFFDSHYHNQVWKQIAKQIRGTEFSDEEMNTCVHGKNNEKVIDSLVSEPISREENTRLSKEKEAQYRSMVMEHPETSKLAPGAITLMNALKEHGIPFTIASASIKENIDFYVSYFKLDQWIDPETITYDDGSYEDKVAMFQDAAKRLHVPIERCLVFEDSHSGIHFAHEAKVQDIIAIDSIHEPERYDEFSYLKGIYEDFTQIPIEEIIS